MERGAHHRRPTARVKAAIWLRGASLAVVAGVILSCAFSGVALSASNGAELVVRSLGPAYPEGEPRPPTISAKAAILVDADTGRILFSHAANVRLPMASTTKIMTAIVALESLDLDKKVTISSHAAYTRGSLFGLVPGEKLTVEELLYALMVLSGNDVAIALAEASAGSTAAFVARMNDKARELGLKNTHFANTNGLQAEKHYSSAKDLATLAAYAMRNPVFCRVVNTSEYEAIRPGPDGLPAPKLIENHNLLLREYPWVTGVKTGSTPYAKYCLVFSGCQDGVSLIGVLLGAKDDETRWKEAKAILDYGFSASPRVILAERGQTMLTLDPADPLGRKIRLVSDKALVKRLLKDDQVLVTAKLQRDAALPVVAGEVFGTLEFVRNGDLLGVLPLLAAEPVEKATIAMIMLGWQDMWPPGVPLCSRS